jgi:hypothetical protein
MELGPKAHRKRGNASETDRRDISTLRQSLHPFRMNIDGSVKTRRWDDVIDGSGRPSGRRRTTADEDRERAAANHLIRDAAEKNA